MKVELGIVYKVAPSTLFLQWISVDAKLQTEICFIFTILGSILKKTDSFVEALALIKVLAT